MYKSTVTRTFSIGAVCSRTEAPDDFSTARRHSSAGIRALLKATSSAKSFASSLGSDSQSSRENIFPNILTPDNIPQFTIPSLSVQNSIRSPDKETEGDDGESEEGWDDSGSQQETSACVSPSCSTSSSGTSSPSFSLVLSDRRAERSVSDPFTQRRLPLQREGSHPCSYTEAQHCLDPSSRAALSLPHLTKVTTPYGFVTLTQSPQMASEEALLCQAGLRRLTNDVEIAWSLRRAPGTKTGDTKDSSSHVSGANKRLPQHTTDSQTKGSLIKAETQAFSAPSTNTKLPSSAGRQPDDKIKRRFYDIIRKHFTSSH